MNFPIYSCFALPLWAAIFAIYFTLRRAELMKESLIAKCAGSFLAVGSAAFAFTVKGENPFTHVIFWFFVLCALADVLLELSFAVGVVAFGAGHVCLMLWLWAQREPSWVNLAVWAAGIAAGVLLLLHDIKKFGRLAPLGVVYVAALSGSLALALPLPLYLGSGYIAVAAGTLCFFISDMMVAKLQVKKLSGAAQKAIMVLYWGALYLISAGLW